MIKPKTLCITALLLSALFANAQSGWQPTQNELAGPLNFLASPLLEGRETGKRGNSIAAEYIASMMELYGLTPAGDVWQGEVWWFQDFEVEEKGLSCRNVLGMIRGDDTSKCVVVGAHFDHLGIRNDSLFVGADDNASGVSGLLALSKRWKNKEQRPPCNLIFAAWDAEEKDFEGSKYFVENFNSGLSSILFYINFDMISRSDPQDTLCNILEIGILKGHEESKEMIERHNALSVKPFILDFWETDGNGGSDYKCFAHHGIPVMAFFAGLNADYHSPADTRDKIDWDKMIRVLKIANDCLEKILYPL
ncbi:MAG: M28 family peptidase [Prevotellaceae bacterium]|jgi:hypothetical protein|nr:M28 family peptidase [Prevotellaceae bacterium]